MNALNRRMFARGGMVQGATPSMVSGANYEQKYIGKKPDVTFDNQIRNPLPELVGQEMREEDVYSDALMNNGILSLESVDDGYGETGYVDQSLADPEQEMMRNAGDGILGALNDGYGMTDYVGKEIKEKDLYSDASADDPEKNMMKQALLDGNLEDKFGIISKVAGAEEAKGVLEEAEKTGGDPSSMLLDFGLSMMACDSPNFLTCVGNAGLMTRKNAATRSTAKEASDLAKAKLEIDKSKVKSTGKKEALAVKKAEIALKIAEAKLEKEQVEASGAGGGGNKIAKVVVDKHTPESVEIFNNTGNYDDLVPREEKVSYKGKTVPLGEGMSQKMQSLDGGKTWEELGVPFIQSPGVVVNMGDKDDYERRSAISSDLTSDTKDGVKVYNNIESAISFLNAPPNAYDVRAAQNAFSALNDPGTRSYREVTDARVLGDLGSRIAEHISQFISGSLSPEGKEELLAHFELQKGVVSNQIKNVVGQYEHVANEFVPGRSFSLFTTSIPKSILGEIEKGKEESAAKLERAGSGFDDEYEKNRAALMGGM